MEKFNEILREGEVFWSHTEKTLNEIKSKIDIMVKTERYLPPSFWDEIAGLHATNESSLYSLTKRFIEFNYPNTSWFKITPSINLLTWIYERLLENQTK